MILFFRKSGLWICAPVVPILVLAACVAAAPRETPIHGFRIVQSYPHDPEAFTQGLAFVNGELYEGTGLNGRSMIRRVDLKTGMVLQQQSLPGEYFGEGIAAWNNRLVQLTWTSKIGFVYDRATMQQLRTFNYGTEGWGLTHDGKRLIMSDGSSTLYFLDPESFSGVGTLEVTDNGLPVRELNELEYIRGEIWANVWQTDRIARISPKTGRVNSWINLAALRDQLGGAQVDVLNGIAFDEKSGRIVVTGKLWPRLFEIEVTPR